MMQHGVVFMQLLVFSLCHKDVAEVHTSASLSVNEVPYLNPLGLPQYIDILLRAEHSQSKLLFLLELSRFTCSWKVCARDAVPVSLVDQAVCTDTSEQMSHFFVFLHDFTHHVTLHSITMLWIFFFPKAFGKFQENEFHTASERCI